MRDSATRWTARFELIQGSGDGGGVAIKITFGVYRSGKILLNGHEIPFRLSGSHGRYDDLPGDHVSFDREGNGTYESYDPHDGWVNLVGKTYEFHVDPRGASLILKESESSPDRPSLKPGSPIPDVSLPDIEGKPMRSAAIWPISPSSNFGIPAVAPVGKRLVKRSGRGIVWRA
jgi:hypothetical protein